MSGAGRINDVVAQVITEFPPALQTSQQLDAKRGAYHAGLALGLAPDGPIVDAGGGIGLLSVVCAALGADFTLIDDFGDQVNERLGDSVLDLHRRYGVKVVKRNVIAEGLGLADESIELFMSFDNIEHVHDSPKAMLHEAFRAVRHGGHMLIGAPNSANLRKRLDATRGRAKWSSMSDWYEQPKFRGHVREPDIGDLRYIAQDLGLADVKVFGRNWQAYQASDSRVRWLAPHIDRPLRRWPSLCADIYVTGRKP